MEERDMEKNFDSLPVGDTFEWCKLIYEVKESPSCKDCWFCSPDCGCTADPFERWIPHCGSDIREDGKSVVFVKVGEVQD